AAFASVGGDLIDDATVEELILEFAQARAKALGLEIEDQMKELGGTKELPYVSLCKQIIQHAVRYGVGILKGPLVRTQDQTRWRRNPMTGAFETSTVSTPRPYFEVCSPWNYYPDMSAKTFCSMDGQFERHVMNRRQLLELADKPGFDSEQIKAFIDAHKEGNFRWRSFENEIRDSKERPQITGKFEALEFWGQATVRDLREEGVEVASDLQDDEMVEARVWTLDCHVIKAELNPYDPWMQPYHQFIFEEDENSLLGNGLPAVMEDSQKGICAATRMLVDNAAVSAGPMFEVNRSLLAPDADSQRIHAFKVWHRDEDGPNAQFPAVREIRVTPHVQELMAVLSVFRDFADAESFVTPALQADVSG
ncbi:MAG: hypothetical protein ACREX8_17355, partial [Gammaproteobacteria bacterium]